MCGIAGIWQLDGQQVKRATIDRFIGALVHRGPDGQGVLVDDAGRLALAHRRLAILDLSPAGHQPMRSASGRYDITYNGEIYNFLELRAELEQHGVRFCTATEVILAGSTDRWSKVSSEEYEQVIVPIRQCLKGKPLWEIEEYWQGNQ